MKCAGDENRTHTGIASQGILSPWRLPVPPPRQRVYYIKYKNLSQEVFVIFFSHMNDFKRINSLTSAFAHDLLLERK